MTFQGIVKALMRPKRRPIASGCAGSGVSSSSRGGGSALVGVSRRSHPAAPPSRDAARVVLLCVQRVEVLETGEALRVLGRRPRVRLDVVGGHRPAEEARDVGDAMRGVHRPERGGAAADVGIEERVRPGGLDVMAERFEVARGLLDGARALGVHVAQRRADEQADAQAAGVGAELVGEPSRRRRHGVEVAGLGAVHRVEGGGDVAHRARHDELGGVAVHLVGRRAGCVRATA